MSMDRFWAKVSVGRENECWEWRGAASKSGYGSFGVSGRTKYSHRISYEAHKGEIPHGFDVCHSCDNRRCVNPAHLWLGTRAQNMADCAAKGRARGPNYKGSQIGTSKLSEAAVADVKIALARGARPADLGRKYGVTPQAISRIKSGKNWAHLKDIQCPSSP